MPYVVVKVKNGYKVKDDKVGRPKFYSKHPLDYETALAQLRAIYLSEKRNKDKYI